MLKCKLEDLLLVSDEEARSSGFFGQYDFYLYVLGCSDSLFFANAIIHRALFHYDCQKEGNFSITDKMKREGIKYFEGLVYANLVIIKNYNEIINAYPEYNNFIHAIKEFPSAKTLQEIKVRVSNQVSLKKWNQQAYNEFSNSGLRKES